MSLPPDAWFGTPANPIHLLFNEVDIESGTFQEEEEIKYGIAENDENVFKTVLGISFENLNLTHCCDILKLISKQKIIGILHPPSYSSDWSGFRRGMEGITKSFPTLKNLTPYENELTSVDLFESLDFAMKMAISWPLRNENSSTHFVNSVSRYAIVLPKLIGHRDYLRVAVHSDDSEIPGRTRTGCFLTSREGSNVPWSPRPGCPSRYTVTLVVLPDLNSCNISERKKVIQSCRDVTAQDVDINRGIYISLTTDIGCASTCSTDCSTGYFEYVRFNTPDNLCRKFFVEFGCALLIPTSCAFRIYSHSIVDVTVIALIHRVSSCSVEDIQQPTDRYEKYHILDFPFRDMEDSKSLPEFGFVPECVSEREKEVVLGTLPSIKGVQSLDLRKHIFKEVHERAAISKVVSPEVPVHVTTVTSIPSFSKSDSSLQCNPFLFKKRVSISQLPMKSILGKAKSESRLLYAYSSIDFEELLKTLHSNI